ncbi:MAG: HAD family hydrolase [Patescibacteria group bacterium]
MPTLSEYLARSKKIERTKHSKHQKGNNKSLKIALLSSSTIQALKEVLSVKCHDAFIKADVYLSGYNQYVQEILNKKSGIYKFNPDIVFLFIDTISLLGNAYFRPYKDSSMWGKKWVNDKKEEIIALLDTLSKKLSGRIVVHNFEVPTFSPLGIAETREESGFIESIRGLNVALQDFYKNSQQIFVFDYELFCSYIGKDRMRDDKMYYIADYKINPQYIPALSEGYMAYIKPTASIIKKCLVLDLDNTLWGGIIGEDGLAGIKLGPTPEGRPFWEFQNYILSLRDRGIILAINSRNNPRDALEVFQKHPSMILKEEHFASVKINWNDKVDNMRSIANELGIGLSSMVFIDDDPSNREIIKRSLPEVLVVDLPSDPSLYLKAVKEINDFNVLQITREDLKKGEMYLDQKKRKELLSSSSTLEDYFKKLETVVVVQKANIPNIPRIAQLTQKTNQFNLTTKRYTEKEISNMVDKGYLVVSVSVKDKFGDNGIVGVVIVERKNNIWRIDTLLLSCRLIGRGVEKVLLGYVLNLAKKEDADIVVGVYIPTEKNMMTKDFYKQNNFCEKKVKGEIVWEHNLQDKYVYPDFLTVEEK